MPNVEYVPRWREGTIRRSMPYECWQTLTERGRRIARAAVCDAGVWPAGAGVMHPLRSERQKAAGV